MAMKFTDKRKRDSEDGQESDAHGGHQRSGGGTATRGSMGWGKRESHERKVSILEPIQEDDSEDRLDGRSVDRGEQSPCRACVDSQRAILYFRGCTVTSSQ